MTTFWSLWIIVITVGTLVGCAILLTWCAKDKMGVEEGEDMSTSTMVFASLITLYQNGGHTCL